MTSSGVRGEVSLLSRSSALLAAHSLACQETNNAVHEFARRIRARVDVFRRGFSVVFCNVKISRGRTNSVLNKKYVCTTHSRGEPMCVLEEKFINVKISRGGGGGGGETE